DRNIPKAGIADKSRFAVIIGNQHYRGGVAEVEFANKDARVFAEYCKDALGIPESNVRLYTDATYGDMLGAMKDIAAIAAAYGGNIDVVFYYAGHGIPGESDRSAYLMPVDADGSMTEVCMPLDALYSKLAALDARSVLVFLDACFSGSQRGDGMLMAARGVQIKAKATQPRGRMVTFSAASGDQTAYPAKNEGHGIFTYYLLEKIKETRGEVTLGDLADHVITNVAQQSVVLNRKVQIPNVSASLEMADKWQQMKLR
ncbi:MAG: caspase family protein, partial [Muribaculaceae bacterium]|nr:caspase family protein [Muribaculaceae bacterium]